MGSSSSPKLVLTNDGSHTLYTKKYDEHYHSIHGSIGESKHVFIQSGYRWYINRNPSVEDILVFEVGLGTGLNALLTLVESATLNVSTNYTSIEAFPISNELIASLNFIERLALSDYEAAFNAIHKCEWSKLNKITPTFALAKLLYKLEDITLEQKYHVIYFDAFAPDKQPEMWQEDIFIAMYKALLNGGCLVTYCAKGVVKRRLKGVGFRIESIPGPPGKREMTRAVKD